MSSMVINEAVALAELATALGQPATAASLLQRAGSLRAQLSTLWDPTSHAFVNQFVVNGSFYRRISPTSFYGLLAGAATDDQATQMVSEWLLNPDHFCIAPNGDFANNSDSCYWGLPSIQASDPAFPPLGYWRGYVWGPMAQLTYWSLQNYAHLPIVKQVRCFGVLLN